MGASRLKLCVCGRSLAGMVGSNPPGGFICLSLVIVVCCEKEVSTKGRSLVQRVSTECGVSECDPGPSYRRPMLGKAVEL